MTSALFDPSVKSRRTAGSMLMLDPPIELLSGGVPGPRRFKIKAADVESRRGLVATLLKGRQLLRGSQANALAADRAERRLKLVAVEDQVTIGTVTLVFDARDDLPADDAFSAELQAMRSEGRRLCQFTKLAVDPTVGSKRMLGALFHVAYIVAHRIRGFDTLLIEVNPRHARQYERMLGCRVLAGVRVHRGVAPPTVLLALDFAHMMAQIGRFGGQPESAAEERSLYPFTFALSEEASIITRLRARYEHWLDERATGPAGDSVFQPSDLAGL